MKNQAFEYSNLAEAMRSVAFATIASFVTIGTANAATFAIDFTGTAIQGSTTGNFATELVTLDQVTGSVFIDDTVPFSLTAGSPNLLNSGIVNSVSMGAISSTVTFGTITETFSTSTLNNAGQVQINEGPPANADSFFVNITDTPRRFDFQLLETSSLELFSGDASLGFSLSLLQSIDLANADAGAAQGSVFFSTNGNLVFSIDSISVREVNPAPINPVPLPAGLPLLLAALGGVFLLRRHKT